MRFRDIFSICWFIYSLPFLLGQSPVFNFLWDYIDIAYYVYGLFILLPIEGVICWTYLKEDKQKEVE